jgi:hypothetical protein
MTPGLYHWYDGPISGLWVTIGLETGYFNLPEVSQDIIEQIYDSFNYYLKDKIYDSENGFVSPISESEREMIVRKYQSEINKGLPKISDADFPTDTRKPVVREKIRRRFESLKEIKDKNPDLSQVGVVLKYNMNHSEEERIEVYDLQYAYKAMGESWEKK